ncbi:uncharacterized protein ACRADG_008450 [Cochliomyia hominivorax]
MHMSCHILCSFRGVRTEQPSIHKMNSTDSNESYCRLCLKGNAFFNWSEPVFEFYGPSYKECLQKYIKLPEKDDAFSKSLCLDCGIDLRNMHKMVEKAHVSFNKITKGEQCRICFKKEGFFEWTEEIFEFFGPTYKECYLKYTQLQEKDGNKTEQICVPCGDVLRNAHQLIETALQSEKDLEDGSYKIIHVDPEEETNEEQNVADKSNSSKKERTYLCSYCSKISHTKAHHIKHEELHTRGERKESCPICGLKFYSAVRVKHHLAVHDENRVAKYKCELCPRTFFTPSGLRYHRVTHTGEVAKCNSCSKSFYRQIDLQYHIRRCHEGISRERRKELKDCKYCGQKVRRENFTPHLRKHLNQPLGKCIICDKSYFNRQSLIRHLNASHNIKNNYDNYIEIFERKYKPRRSILMRKQNIDVI